MPQVQVTIEPAFAGLVNAETLKRTAALALERELRSGPAMLTIILTDDAELRRLNRDFRGVDETTDVLAFGREGAEAGRVPEDGFPLPPGEAASLGEVIISGPQASRQAAAAKRPVAHELALLAAHGVLHLLGYDHANPEDEKAMFARTDAILAEILGPSAVPMAPAMNVAEGPLSDRAETRE